MINWSFWYLANLQSIKTIIVARVNWQTDIHKYYTTRTLVVKFPSFHSARGPNIVSVKKHSVIVVTDERDEHRFSACIVFNK